MGQLTAIVLGSAAGGGFPQWNCRCPVCRLAWDGDRRVKARSQASLAVTTDGRRWLLLNASPDLRTQLARTPSLHPRTGTRGTPIDAVVLTGAEVDQTAGLLHLRESQAFALYATAETLGMLADNPIFDVLSRKIVPRHPVSLDEPFAAAGLEAILFPVPGKLPLYREGADPQITESEANVGVELRAAGRRLVYVPGCAMVPGALRQRLAGADVVLFDGTLFTDDEMIRTGTGPKTGLRMGHMPIDGPAGTLAALADVKARRIFIHINNTNPILVEGSPERTQVEGAGWEVAEDGLRIEL